MDESVKKLANFCGNRGLEILEKNDSIEEYLKNEIANKPDENVFDEKFTFRDIYVPLRAKKVDVNGEISNESGEFQLEGWAKNLLLSSLLNEKSDKDRQVLFIQADPGKGKSVFCRMFADWVRKYLYPYFTPILIRLRDIEDFQNSLEETLRTCIQFSNFAPSSSNWLSDPSRRFLFILDGFDELRIERSNNQSVEKFIRQVGAFQENCVHRGHRVIITGRGMALHGIDYLPPNLERVEIADMDASLQFQWFLKWRHLFPGNKTDDFREFLQDENRCPPQLQELAKEPLLLYMLAAMNRDNKLDINEIRQSESETEAKIAVYEQALEWVLEKQRSDKRHPNLTEQLTQVDTNALKRLLAETAMAVVQSGGEYADIKTVKARLQEDEEAREILKNAEEKLGEKNALKNTLAAFYIKPNQSGGVEFFHKSFREFLCAKRIQRSLEDWTETRKNGKSYYIEEKQLYEQIYDLLGYGVLTLEIVEYLFGLLNKSENFKPVELFKRLEDFYQRWCNGEFIDSTEQNLVINTARNFQKNGIKLGLRAVDVYAGLNVMILLLELHRKRNTKTLDIVFYPFGKPEEDKYNAQLLRIINYSDCVSLNTFKNIVGQFLTGANYSGFDLTYADLTYAYLRSADLRSADLRSVDFTDADLTDADLRSADLSRADFSRADFTRADLSGAYLTDANLTRAYLTDADLRSADLRSADLRSADLRSAGLSGAYLCDADLSGAYLSGADLRSADLTDAYLTNTRFGNNEGISESMKQDLIKRGAIFEDTPDDNSTDNDIENTEQTNN